MSVKAFPSGGSTRARPGLDQEHALLHQGWHLIAGVDEAGRGAWAGPVYAAAVILPLDRPDLREILDGVADSKQLSPQRREALLPGIYEVALGVGVGWAAAPEIDEYGIVAATRRAMERAIFSLSPPPEALVIDHIRLPAVVLPQRALPKADQQCLSVAAASIVAKVTRDRWMGELDEQQPGYGFVRHKGYGTAEHREALARLGPSPFHRMSWAPLQSVPRDCEA
jgi:ribonuclease HII